MYYLSKVANELPTNALALEAERAKAVKANNTELVEKIDAHRRNLVSKARGKDLGWSKGGKGLEATQKAIKGTAITGAELAKYDPSSLTFTQNMKALGHEFKPGASWRPDKVVQKGWRNLGEGAGGYQGGAGMGRYNPLGPKTITGIFALGDAKDAVNRSDPTGEKRSRTERTGYMMGGALGGTAGALSAKSVGRIGGLKGTALNIALSLGGMYGGYYAGGKAGKAIDIAASKARGVEAGDYTRTQRARIKKKLSGGAI